MHPPPHVTHMHPPPHMTLQHMIQQTFKIMRLSLSFVSLFMQEISLSITYPPPHMYPPPHLTLSLYRDFIHAGNLLGP